MHAEHVGNGDEVLDTLPQDHTMGAESAGDFQSLTAAIDNMPTRPVLTSRQPRPAGIGGALAERVVELDLCKSDTSPGPGAKNAATSGIAGTGAMQGTLRDLQKKEKLYQSGKAYLERKIQEYESRLN